jgi:secondary thiamine-phosphate synthase enzyme
MSSQLQSLKAPEPAGFATAGQMLEYTTRQKTEFINLTDDVERSIRESGIRDGIAVVQSLHSTTGLLVNEWQEALLDDFRALLKTLVSANTPWKHNDPRFSDCDRGNAVSHLRAALLGSSAVLAVRGGRLVRGTWQSIILAELDGPRTRSVSIQVFGGLS